MWLEPFFIITQYACRSFLLIVMQDNEFNTALNKRSTTFCTLYISRTSSNAVQKNTFFVFCSMFVCLSMFLQSCQTCVREDRRYIVFYVNKFKFTVATHSCMSFEALKPVCMKLQSFFLLLIYKWLYHQSTF